MNSSRFFALLEARGCVQWVSAQGARSTVRTPGFLVHSGAKARTRTADRTIFSRELYQLSYLGGGCGAGATDASVGDRGLEPLTSTV